VEEHHNSWCRVVSDRDTSMRVAAGSAMRSRVILDAVGPSRHIGA
jgi:hypothetical protein